MSVAQEILLRWQKDPTARSFRRLINRYDPKHVPDEINKTSRELAIYICSDGSIIAATGRTQSFMVREVTKAEADTLIATEKFFIDLRNMSPKRNTPLI